MDPQENRTDRVTRVAKEMGAAIRKQARTKWKQVSTAERNEQGRHVWRFRSGPDQDERFLHIEHRTMVQGRNPAARLLKQLESQQWADRLEEDPSSALLLARNGQLVAVHDR
ncbi:MAG: hypothetical protein WD737_03040 [Gemmatimonadota bacterium]